MSSNSKTNNAEKPPVVVGKLLARVYYEDGKLTVRINRIAGLSGGANKEKLYNPYVKLYLIPGRIKLDKFRTNCLWKTRNPVFNATFQVNIICFISTLAIATSKSVYGGLVTVSSLKWQISKY